MVKIIFSLFIPKYLRCCKNYSLKCPGVLIFSLFLFLISCESPSPADPQPSTTYFVQVIAQDSLNANDSIDYYIDIIGSFLGSPIPAIKQLTLDNKSVNPLSINYNANGFSFMGRIAPKIIDGKKRVQIISDCGDVYGDISIPLLSDTMFTSHSYNDTIPYNEAITLEWKKTAETFRAHCSVKYLSTSVTYLFQDSIVHGNSLTIPASSVVDTLFRIRFDIYGFNGIEIKPGAIGNMQGDAQGFLRAENHAGAPGRIYLYFKS